MLKLVFTQDNINNVFLNSVYMDAIKDFNYLLDSGVEKDGVIIKANPHYQNDQTMNDTCHFTYKKKREYVCNFEMIRKSILWSFQLINQIFLMM